jgi:hypothetical protein
MAEQSANSNSEILRTPEELMTSLVERIDRGLGELHLPPRDQRGSGDCNFVPDAASYCAFKDAAENGYTATSVIIQPQDLHFKAAGRKTEHEITHDDYKLDDQGYIINPDDMFKDPLQSEIARTTFRHGVNIVTINGAPFIVDLSFSQFLQDDGMIGEPFTGKSSGIPNDHPIAQALMEDGFVPLTDDSLRAYLRLLSTTDHNYLAGVTTNLLDQIQPAREFTMDDNELMGKIPPAYQ